LWQHGNACGHECAHDHAHGRMLSRVAGQRGAVQEPLATALRGALSAGNACERNARFLVGVGASGAAVREPWPVLMGVMAERDASSNPVRSDFLFCFRRPRKIQTMVFRHTFYRGFPWVRVLAPDRVLTPERPPAASKQRLASQSAVRAYFVPVRSPQPENAPLRARARPRRRRPAPASYGRPHIERALSKGSFPNIR